MSDVGNKVTSIEASIRDLKLKYKLEDDPKKQSVILDELKCLEKERREAQTKQNIENLVLGIFLVIILFTVVFWMIR